MFGFDHTTADPKIFGGRVYIRGMHISVSLLVNLVAKGMTTAEIITDCPDVELENIRHALQYGT